MTQTTRGEYVKQIIRTYAGQLSAEQIGELVGLSAKAVHHRAQGLGISLQRRGEHHPGASVPDAAVRAAQVLYDHGGYRPEQIKTLIVGLQDVSKNTIWAWLDGRNRGC